MTHGLSFFNDQADVAVEVDAASSAVTASCLLFPQASCAPAASPSTIAFPKIEPKPPAVGSGFAIVEDRRIERTSRKPRLRWNCILQLFANLTIATGSCSDSSVKVCEDNSLSLWCRRWSVIPLLRLNVLQTHLILHTSHTAACLNPV